MAAAKESQLWEPCMRLDSGKVQWMKILRVIHYHSMVIAKNALRQSLLLLTQNSDVKIYWLRAYYILGDDRRNSSIFTKLLQAVEDGKEEFPFTSGENKYDFIDIKDLAMEIVAASTQDEITGIINVCTGNPVALKDKVEAFIKEKGLPIKLK